MSHTPKNITDPDSHVDEWFDHDPNEPHHQQEHGEFNAVGVYLTLGATILGTFGVAVVVIIWVAGLVNETKTEYQEQSVYVKQEKVTYFTQWDKQLYDDPAWINQQEGTVRLPLDMASERVVGMYAGQE